MNCSLSVRRREGFSLVEVMLASVILVLTLVGFLSLTNYLFGLEEDSREVQTATAAATSKIEEIRAYAKESWGLLLNTYNNKDFRVPGLEPATNSPNADTDGFPGKITITTDSADVYTVAVEIRWRHARRNQRLDLVTKITNRG